MLQIAGVKTQAEFYKKYPTEAAFFRAHPEAEMLKHAAMGGSYYYADGGGMPPQGGMQQGAPEQGQPQGGGGDEQMQQIVQFIGQALQQGMQPEEIVQKLVEAGLPQDQAMQLVQAVMQQMQGGGGQGGAPQQGPQEEMMEGSQGQEAPPQEMAEGQPPMGMYGGGYARGGMYASGGDTYYQGMSYANGGPFIPQYGDIAWNVDYATGGEAGAGNELVMQVAQLLQQGVQPEAILQQLVQAKIPQKKAVKLIQMVMQKLQAAGGAAQPAAAPNQSQDMMMAFGGPTYSKRTQYNHQGIVPALDWMGNGGSVKYKKGGEYEMTHDDVQKLIQQGYKIQYL